MEGGKLNSTMGVIISVFRYCVARDEDRFCMEEHRRVLKVRVVVVLGETRTKGKCFA